MRVFVYYNLHRHCLSLRSCEKGTYGKVLLHCSEVELVDAEFCVSEKGRQRVLLERRKNVHAGVRGRIVSSLDALSPVATGEIQGRPVTYDPYKFTSFVFRDNGEPVFTADRVFLRGRDVRVLEASRS